MPNYTHIVFDLDGTIVASGPGIIASLRFAFARLGIQQTLTDEQILAIIGPPLTQGVKSLNPELFQDEALLHEVIATARMHHVQEGIALYEVYPGIPELLVQLKNAGKMLYIATSKPHILALKTLEHQHLLQYFDIVAGNSGSGKEIGKTEIIGNLLVQLPRINRAQMIMIGDRYYDIEGAKAHLMHSLGVTYGYGSLSELQQAHPTYITKDVLEMKAKLLDQ